MLRVLFSFIFLFSQLSAIPISPTNVAWSSIFPIKVGGGNGKVVCACPGVPPRVGIPISFWDPAYVVDVTVHPGKLVAFGGLQASIGKNTGVVDESRGDGSRTSFFHVHMYRYPIMSALGLLNDTGCLGKSSGLSLLYLSEFDPTWNNDYLASLIRPDAHLYANPQAQAACIADCASATAGKPLDSLYWCSGCEGSLFPLMGYVGHHTSGLQASSLIVHRLLTRLHTAGVLLDYPKGEFCSPKYSAFPSKRNYKLQLIHPVVERKNTHFIGASDLLWGSGKQSLTHDYCYIVWVKRQCCLSSTSFIPVLESGGVL